MKARLTIFLSGVSHEFGTFRDAVENEIQKKGCFAENQSSFAPDYRTVEEMLRRKLTDADAVIHMVGFRFGAEPNQRPPDLPRRSYTQMEFDIARSLEKPVFIFISKDASVRQPPSPTEQPEDAEFVRLQIDHRDAVTKTNYLYSFFKDEAELRSLVAAISIVAQAGEFRPEVSRIDKYAPAHLVGREEELKLLDDAWLKVRRAESPRPHILTFVALGGEGKTSIVAKWAAELAAQDWPGCDAAFAWPFDQQGTDEKSAGSSDLFLKEALTFFGDEETANSAKHPSEKGKKLAELVGLRRSLLILDGLEPLQYAPTSTAFSPGQLKDEAIAKLLKDLAAASHGLCIVTTRYSLPDLKAFWQTTAPEVKLVRLSRDAGVRLLQSLCVKGSLLRNIPFRDGREPVNEFEKLVEDVQGHALTLNLLGTYLRDAHAGDIRKRDLIKLEEADAEEQGGHAFRVMEAYGREFEREGDKGQRALAVLRLLGLFDRPATSDCLGALLQAPAISGLTEALVNLTEAQRNLAFKRLDDARLLTVNRDASGTLDTLDAHPLLREYFARQLRTQQPDAWREGHRRLYEHLCATTKEGDQPTLEELQPLYQAVAHGCQAGLQQEVAQNIYYGRIQGSGKAYSVRKLGLFGSDLAATACFFEQPWSRVAPALEKTWRAWLLNEAATRLRGIGRLTESLEPLRAALEMGAAQESWKNAAISASNLSELELTLGEVAGAVGDAEQSVTYADRSSATHQRQETRSTHADALHQAGRPADAETRFREAEQMQKEMQPDYPLLYSVRGFKYCDLLLAAPERAAWQQMIGRTGSPPPAADDPTRSGRERRAQSSPYLGSCRAVYQRAAQTLKWTQADSGAPLLDIALDHFMLGRAALYAAILEGRAGSPLLAADDPTRSDSERRARSDAPYLETARRELDAAVDGLRRAGTQHRFPPALLTRAWLRFLTGARTGPGSAQEDLDEAWEIAERGPMKLFIADIHLYRARLFREKEYPKTWISPHADLAEARRLIEKCGYGRRKDELEEAEAGLRQQHS